MAIRMRNGVPLSATMSKEGVLYDLEALIARVSKIARGDVKFLDANTRQVSAAIKQLRETKTLLETCLIPTSQE